MAPFVIFFHTGNITLDTNGHVESLKEYLDGLESSCLFRISHQVQGWPPFDHISSFRYIMAIRSPEGLELCQGFYIGANSFFFTFIFYINKVRANIIIFEINKFFILKLFNSKLKFIIS